MTEFECCGCGSMATVSQFQFSLLSQGIGECVCSKCEAELDALVN